MSILDILKENQEAFCRGLGVTLEICAIVWGVGLSMGTVLGMIGARWRIAAGIPLKVFGVLLAGMPVIVFMFWLHYPLQHLLGVVIRPFITAAFALSCVNVFLVADLVKRTIADFPTQYVWAAKVCGLGSYDTIRHVQFPIIMREILPGLLSIQIIMLQSSIFASLISVDEVFRICQQINAQIYKPVEIYTILALLFIVVCVPLHGLVYYLRLRFTRDLSDR